MSEQSAENNLANFYLFLGVDDFETDTKRIKAAFENLEQIYGLKFDKLRTGTDAIVVPEHFKEHFPEWSEEESKEFIKDIANAAAMQRAVFSNKKKRDAYDTKLREQPELLQGISDGKKKEKVFGRQFSPDSGEGSLEAYFDYLDENVLSVSGFTIKDDGDVTQIQKLLNRFIVAYHKYNWDLKHKPQEPKPEFKPEDLEKPEEKDISNSLVIKTPNEVHGGDIARNEETPESVEGDYIQADKPEEKAAPEREGNTLDGEATVKSHEPEPESETETEASDDVDADFVDEPANDQEKPKSKVNSDFSAMARGTYLYPENGRENVADCAAPMLIKNVKMTLGNANLRVMTSIEGRKFLNQDCGFALDGRLDVEGLPVSHADKPAEHVAVFGKVDIKCNGGFFNGNIDGRIRTTKYTPQVIQGEGGQPQQVDVPEHKYSKGKVVIDAGSEDVVINGDLIGNVEIKTTGKVRILGHIDGKVKINAGAGVDVYGNVSGAKIHSTGAVDIRGKKSFLTSLSGNAFVRGNDVTDSMLQSWRVDAAKKHFSALDGHDVADDNAASAQQSTHKKDAPHV